MRPTPSDFLSDPDFAAGSGVVRWCDFCGNDATLANGGWWTVLDLCDNDSACIKVECADCRRARLSRGVSR
jgi:hypothetical protein